MTSTKAPKQRTKKTRGRPPAPSVSKGRRDALFALEQGKAYWTSKPRRNRAARLLQAHGVPVRVWKGFLELDSGARQRVYYVAVRDKARKEKRA